jgi:hypothetical protein
MDWPPRGIDERMFYCRCCPHRPTLEYADLHYSFANCSCCPRHIPEHHWDGVTRLPVRCRACPDSGSERRPRLAVDDLGIAGPCLAATRTTGGGTCYNCPHDDPRSQRISEAVRQFADVVAIVRCVLDALRSVLSQNRDSVTSPALFTT